MPFIKFPYRTLLLLTLFWFVISESFAQSAVPSIKQQDTLESLKNSDVYKAFQADSVQLTLQSQRSLDSLFAQEDQLQASLRNAAKIELETMQKNNEKTLKDLKKEEKELQSKLKKENRKTDRWLNKGLKNGFKKTRYPEDELSINET